MYKQTCSKKYIGVIVSVTIFINTEHNLGCNIYRSKNCYLPIKFIIEYHKIKDRHNKMNEINTYNDIFYFTVKNNAS